MSSQIRGNSPMSHSYKDRSEYSLNIRREDHYGDAGDGEGVVGPRKIHV